MTHTEAVIVAWLGLIAVPHGAQPVESEEERMSDYFEERCAPSPC